jgi:hypothetical protein
MNATARRITTPVVGAALLVVVGAGVALAYYRSNVAASGTGSAAAAATSTVTLSVTGNVATGLYPGGPGADVTFNVTNPYSTPITLTGVTAGTITLSAGTCTTSALTVVSPATGLPATVNGGATASVTLTGVVKMGLGATSNCQGASFAVPFQITGKL